MNLLWVSTTLRRPRSSVAIGITICGHSGAAINAGFEESSGCALPVGGGERAVSERGGRRTNKRGGPCCNLRMRGVKRVAGRRRGVFGEDAPGERQRDGSVRGRKRQVGAGLERNAAAQGSDWLLPNLRCRFSGCGCLGGERRRELQRYRSTRSDRGCKSEQQDAGGSEGSTCADDHSHNIL